MAALGAADAVPLADGSAEAADRLGLAMQPDRSRMTAADGRAAAGSADAG